MKIESFILLNIFSLIWTQQPFYASNKPKSYTFGDKEIYIPDKSSYSLRNDIDTDAIIRPILSPVERMFQIVEESKNMYDYAEKYEEKKKASMFDPNTFLEAIGLKPTTTTIAPTFVEKLFGPFIQPFKKEFERYAKESPLKSITPTVPLSKNLINNDSPRYRQPSSSIPEVKAYTDFQKLANSFHIDPNFEPLKSLKQSPHIFPLIENNNNDEKFFNKNEDQKDIFGFPKPDTIDLRNPFTANPLMSIFTTVKPKLSVDDVIEKIPKIFKPVFPTPKPDDLLKFHTLLPIPTLPNPYDNPLLPKIGNKLAKLA